MRNRIIVSREKKNCSKKNYLYRNHYRSLSTNYQNVLISTFVKRHF